MRVRVSVLLGLLLGVVFCTSAVARGKVFLVHSYNTDYPWTNDVTQSVEAALGEDAQIEVFYMDTKRKTSDAWKKAAGEKAAAKMEELKPDVVITVDDNAQEYFAKKFAGKADAPQFVFCGVNADPEKYGYPASNVTGILERNKIGESLALLKRIVPSVEKVAVITDDGPTSSAVIAYAKTLDLPVKVVSYDQPSTFDEWKAAIRKHGDAADAVMILLYQTVKRAPGAESMDPKEVIGWTMENLAKPTVGTFDFAMEDGVLCGIAESGEEQATDAAKIAVEILKGKTADDVAITTSKKGRVILNAKTAERLKVEMPPDLIRAADVVIE